jgi:hypothetical protein
VPGTTLREEGAAPDADIATAILRGASVLGTLAVDDKPDNASRQRDSQTVMPGSSPVGSPRVSRRSRSVLRS